MPIHGQCPGCGRKFQAPDKFSGKRVKCPNCSAVIGLGGGQRETSQQTPSRQEASQTPGPPQRAGEKEPQWYAKSADGEQLGPMSKTQLDGLVDEERLDGFCQVRRQDWQQWKWAEAVYPQFVLPVEPDAQDEGPEPPAGTDPQSVAAEVDNRLRPCPDCGQMVSKRASQCPHCGCPLEALDDRAAAPAAAAQQTAEPRSATVSPQKTVAGKRKHVRLLVAVAVSAVLLIGVVVVGAGWMLWSWLGGVDEQVQSLPAHTPILPQQPSQPEEAEDKPPTPEEMQQYMEEAAEDKAKQVDEMYKQAHLVGSGLDRFQKSADLLRSIIEDPLGDPGDDLTTAAETKAEPYQSQYKPLYEECISYIRENIAAGQLDRATVRDLANRWADGKRDPLDKKLLEQILIPQEP